jgi:long-subunit acyl-CoA synthetase (AMP-forming)
MLSYLPLAHVAERVLVEHGWLHTGKRLYFAESLDTFAADLQRARPTVFFSVPRLWVKFQQGVQAKMPPAKLQLLRPFRWSAGWCASKILKALGLDQLPHRRRRRRADAAGAARVVRAPGPADQRGLRHDREPGGRRTSRCPATTSVAASARPTRAWSAARPR